MANVRIMLCFSVLNHTQVHDEKLVPPKFVVALYTNAVCFNWVSQTQILLPLECTRAKKKLTGSIRPGCPRCPSQALRTKAYIHIVHAFTLLTLVLISGCSSKMEMCGGQLFL